MCKCLQMLWFFSLSSKFHPAFYFEQLVQVSDSQTYFHRRLCTRWKSRLKLAYNKKLSWIIFSIGCKQPWPWKCMQEGHHDDPITCVAKVILFFKNYYWNLTEQCTTSLFNTSHSPCYAVYTGNNLPSGENRGQIGKRKIRKVKMKEMLLRYNLKASFLWKIMWIHSFIHFVMPLHT